MKQTGRFLASPEFVQIRGIRVGFIGAGLIGCPGTFAWEGAFFLRVS
jgi:hypothetical protein